MAQDFSGGLSGKGKMQSQMDTLRKPAPKENMGGGEEKQHTITEHGDGHFSSHMHGGEPMEHPDHLHMLAHVGHHVTGGDKHHMTHHDGMSMHSHGIHEDDTHEETQEHGSPEEAGEGLKQFMGGDEAEGQPEESHEQESAPLGGM